MKQISELSPSRATTARTIFEVFKIFKEEGGSPLGKEIQGKVRERLEFNDWEKDVLDKTGHIRWELILYFFSVNCIKLAYLVQKQKGLQEKQIFTSNSLMEIR
jgi:restriction system protein